MEARLSSAAALRPCARLAQRSAAQRSAAQRGTAARARSGAPWCARDVASLLTSAVRRDTTCRASLSSASPRARISRAPLPRPWPSLSRRRDPWCATATRCAPRCSRASRRESQRRTCTAPSGPRCWPVRALPRHLHCRLRLAGAAALQRCSAAVAVPTRLGVAPPELRPRRGAQASRWRSTPPSAPATR